MYVKCFYLKRLKLENVHEISTHFLYYDILLFVEQPEFLNFIDDKLFKHIKHK